MEHVSKIEDTERGKTKPTFISFPGDRPGSSDNATRTLKRKKGPGSDSDGEPAERKEEPAPDDDIGRTAMPKKMDRKKKRVRFDDAKNDTDIVESYKIANRQFDGLSLSELGVVQTLLTDTRKMIASLDQKRTPSDVSAELWNMYSRSMDKIEEIHTHEMYGPGINQVTDMRKQEMSSLNMDNIQKGSPTVFAYRSLEFYRKFMRDAIASLKQDELIADDDLLTTPELKEEAPDDHRTMAEMATNTEDEFRRLNLTSDMKRDIFEDKRRSIVEELSRLEELLQQARKDTSLAEESHQQDDLSDSDDSDSPDNSHDIDEQHGSDKNSHKKARENVKKIFNEQKEMWRAAKERSGQNFETLSFEDLRRGFTVIRSNIDQLVKQFNAIDTAQKTLAGFNQNFDFENHANLSVGDLRRTRASLEDAVYTLEHDVTNQDKTLDTIHNTIQKKQEEWQRLTQALTNDSQLGPALASNKKEQFQSHTNRTNTTLDTVSSRYNETTNRNQTVEKISDALYDNIDKLEGIIESREANGDGDR